MVEVVPQPAFNAFETQLRSLCLKEFPCGLGSWVIITLHPLGMNCQKVLRVFVLQRSLKIDKRKLSHLTKKAQNQDRFGVTLVGRNHQALSSMRVDL